MDQFQTQEQDFTSKHPILSLILNQDDATTTATSTINLSTLGDFVDYSLRNGNPGHIPYTLTNFYGEYVSFSIVRFLQKDRKTFEKRNLLWDIESNIKKLAKVAYLSRIKGLVISGSVLRKILFPDKRNKDSFPLEWKLESFGLLEEVLEPEIRRKTGNGTIIGTNSRKINRLNFIEDQVNDNIIDNNDDDDEDDDDEDDNQKNPQLANPATAKGQKQGRWLAITGRLNRKSTRQDGDHLPVGKASPGSTRGQDHSSNKHTKSVTTEKRIEARQKYRFKEKGIEEFLVAKHHFQKALLKCSVDGILMTSSMRRSVRKLPDTGDIWRMTLGLLGKSNKTSALVRGIVSEIVEECKLCHKMTPFDITALCIEAVYESENASNLSEILDEFTFNQTINYSTCSVPKNRLPYAVSAVGYLVRTSGSIYGVHLAYLRLNSSTISMLADPVNAVSDNHLQVLNLSGNFELGASSVRRLMRFLVKASHLTHLDLSGCRIGDHGLRLLSEFFECWPLQFLRVSSNGITDIGVSSLARNFKFVPTLEWLDLSDNRITDRTAAILAAALPVLPQLRSLDLRRNLLGDFGTDVLTRTLGSMRQITSLVLAENQIGERGASALARNLWKTKSLRYVNISLNSIPTSTIVGLRRVASSRGTIHVNADVQNKSATDLSSSAVSSTEHVYDLTGEGLVHEDNEDDDDDDKVEEEAKRKSWKSMGDVCKSVDLLAGRRDEVPLSERKKGLRPRRGPLSRSWHGLNESIRSSFRRNRAREDQFVNG